MISNYLDQSGQAHHNNNAVTVTKPIENKNLILLVRSTLNIRVGVVECGKSNLI